MIDRTQESVATTVSANLTMLYWQIGNRIRNEILNCEQAEYGKKIVAAVTRQSTFEYGKGFSEKNLRRIIQFAELFPEKTNCRSTAATIDLDPFHNPHPH
jgi:hypothetical protein